MAKGDESGISSGSKSLQSMSKWRPRSKLSEPDDLPSGSDFMKTAKDVRERQANLLNAFAIAAQIEIDGTRNKKRADSIEERYRQDADAFRRGLQSISEAGFYAVNLNRRSGLDSVPTKDSLKRDKELRQSVIDNAHNTIRRMRQAGYIG